VESEIGLIALTELKIDIGGFQMLFAASDRLQ
jgi:hypothetical protein